MRMIDKAATAGVTDNVAAGPKMVGARIRRTEDPRLLTGNGAYVDDRQQAGMLHVAFRRSDHSHARIKSIDCDAARGAPGVIAVFTAADLEDRVKPMLATSRMANYHATAIFALAQGKVRYVGEPVVAVVAESRYLAEDALEFVEIDFESLPTIIDAEAAARPDAPLLHEGAGTNVLVAREFKRGDVDVAMESAAVRVAGRFRMHRKTPLAIENRCYVAEYSAGQDTLTLYASTQVPGIIRDALSEALDIPGNRLRVVAPDVGGGFGGKASLYPEELFVAFAARHLGRHVKWTSDRLEDLASTSQGFDEIIDAELGLDKDGFTVALRADVIGDVGAYSIYPWTAALEPVQVVSFLPGPYKIQHYRGRVRGVATSKPPMGPYRGVGRPASTFVTERLLDMAARKLNIDPKALRLQNMVQPDEFPYKIGSGIVWDQCSFTECLVAACDAVDYPALRKRQAAARAEGRWFGIGIACFAELTGIGSRISAAPGMPINTGTETAKITIDSTGAVTLAVGTAGHGQGHETTFAQVVAEHLGARMRDIRVIHGDSAAVPNATGSYASRSAVLAGGAATLAAKEVKEKVLRAAAHLLEASTDDLEIEDGKVVVAGTDRSITFRQLARAVYSEMGRIPSDQREELSASRTYDPVFGTASTATHVAVLEIDVETYQIKLERFVVAEDCGRLINPMIVDGQIHGAVAQGIGAALYEEMIYNDEGQNVTASLVDYIVPAASEIPPISAVHIESASLTTLGGFRGMGEGGTIGAPAAIANAVSDALVPLGIDVFELPITPERLFRLIENAQSNL
ncbi:MAG: cdhA 3 [Ramlibacter sp.]|jgi:carbon-monoxide dehydrogenase large subunit|nr:cdhA 3 [Ramlibacter sp.]